MAGMSDTDLAVVMRILDANANRCAEGLRVVEEIARFSMQDGTLTASLKDVRHEVRRGVEALAKGALRHRDSVGDVARGSATASELSRGSLDAVARANFARAEEALRVLEEFGKLIDEEGSRLFKSLRFALYAIERGFFAETAAAARIPRPPVPVRDPRPERRRSRERGVGGGSARFGRRRHDPVPREAGRRGGKAPRCRRDPRSGAGRVDPRSRERRRRARRRNGRGRRSYRRGGHPAGEARSMVGPGRLIGVSVTSLDELARVPLGCGRLCRGRPGLSVADETGGEGASASNS